MANKPSIRELEKKITELKKLSKSSGVDLSEEISQLEKKAKALLAEETPATTGDPTDEWETVKVARHPKRPYTLDYLKYMLDDFYELRGDRFYGDDQAMIAALGHLGGRSVMILGHQKGKTAEENRIRNFGMPHPEGYRKAIRAMEMAERFELPIISIIDTPGAYPGVEAEERNIGGAIAQSIYHMAQTRVPIVVVVIGEGGSGGALGIGVGDRVLMLKNAIYSVISPEGCASILWRDRDMAPAAARAMKITSNHLLGLGIIDEIVDEPQGGAHRDPAGAADNLKAALIENLTEIASLDTDELLERRAERLQSMGIFEELRSVAESPPAGSEGG